MHGNGCSILSGLILKRSTGIAEFRLISHVHEAFRVCERFIPLYANAGGGKRNSHPRGTMLCSRDMLRRVTGPRALTRAVFRPLGQVGGSAEPTERLMLIIFTKLVVPVLPFLGTATSTTGATGFEKKLPVAPWLMM